MTFRCSNGIRQGGQLSLLLYNVYTDDLNHTLSGRIGKVVASHAAVARSIPLRCTDLYYARGA